MSCNGDHVVEHKQRSKNTAQNKNLFGIWKCNKKNRRRHRSAYLPTRQPLPPLTVRRSDEVYRVQLHGLHKPHVEKQLLFSNGNAGTPGGESQENANPMMAGRRCKVQSDGKNFASQSHQCNRRSLEERNVFFPSKGFGPAEQSEHRSKHTHGRGRVWQMRRISQREE